MNRRDILIGVVVLAVLAAVIYGSRQSPQPLETPTPSSLTKIEEQIEDSFKIQIPEDVEKATLKDVSDGTGSGIATRKFLPAQAGENGEFSHTVLADLPEAEPGFVYEGWLIRGKEGDSNFAIISTGVMRVAKGGWILEFQSSTDYSDYKGVVVTLEKVIDKTPEKHILEGTF